MTSMPVLTCWRRPAQDWEGLAIRPLFGALGFGVHKNTCTFADRLDFASRAIKIRAGLCAHPAWPLVLIGVRAMPRDPVSDDLFLRFACIGQVRLGGGWPCNLCNHGIDNALVSEKVKESVIG